MSDITPEALKAVGFVPYADTCHLIFRPTEGFFPHISCTEKMNFHLFVAKHIDMRDAMCKIYPESMADIESLKRMLTPK